MEPIKRLNSLIENLFTMEKERKENIVRLRQLYKELEIDNKVDNFEELFTFNAINIAGLSLQRESLLTPQPGRYLQIIGIKKSENRSKNINLRYFGKAEKIDPALRAKAAEFVLRWRLEKGFLGVNNYRELLHELQNKVG